MQQIATTEPLTLDAIKATLRRLLPELRRRYPMASVAVFGSWARGETDPDSALDLLTTIDGPIGFEIVTLEDELRRRLGLPVEIGLPSVARCDSSGQRKISRRDARCS